MDDLYLGVDVVINLDNIDLLQLPQRNQFVLATHFLTLTLTIQILQTLIQNMDTSERVHLFGQTQLDDVVIPEHPILQMSYASGPILIR